MSADTGDTGLFCGGPMRELTAQEQEALDNILREPTVAEIEMDSVTTLRDLGYCVVIFNPEELDGANPDKVGDAMIAHAWDIIEILKP